MDNTHTVLTSYLAVNLAVRNRLFIQQRRSEHFFSSDYERSAFCQSITLMEDRKEKTAPWLSVPQFGDWDQQGTLPDYSMDFSKIRENRKQNKRDLSRASLGNEEEFNTSTTASVNTSLRDPQQPLGHHSPTNRKSILRYFNCCVKA